MKKLKLLSMILVLAMTLSFLASCNTLKEMTNGSGDIPNGFYVAEDDENVYIEIKDDKMYRYTYGLEKIYTYEVNDDSILMTDENGESSDSDYEYFESSEIFKIGASKYKKQDKEPTTYNIKGKYYLEKNSAVSLEFDNDKMTYKKADGTVSTFYYAIWMKSAGYSGPMLSLYKNKGDITYRSFLVEFHEDDITIHYSYYGDKADEKFIKYSNTPS